MYTIRTGIFLGLDFIMFDLLRFFIWITSFFQVQVIIWILLRSLEERDILDNILLLYKSHI